MKQVAVRLTRPWPTSAGLRRPQEGIITVSSEDAEAIKKSGVGEIVDAAEKKSRSPQSGG